MLHPVFSNKRTLTIYLSAWAVLAIAQACFLFFYGNVELAAAITDAIIYNTVLIALGLSLWYPLVYTKKQESTTRMLLNNLLAGIVLLALWFGISHMVSSSVLTRYPAYLELAEKIIPLRFITGAFLLMILMAMYHLFIFYHHLEEQKYKAMQLTKQVKEAELKALKAQLNPHFLFNSLNSIGSLTITDPDGARVMLNQLSDFLRYSLHRNLSDLISLREELKNMNRYLEIEKVRFSDRLICEMEYTPHCLDLKLPAMLLQPIYENAIKHGLYESIEPVTIRTYCQDNKGKLEISIINNYDPEAITAKGEGVGIEHVRKTLYNLYNQDSLLTISRENNHFEVSLTIPQT